MARLRDIYDFGDPDVIQALRANISIFSRTVRREQQILAQSDKIKKLEDQSEDLKKRLAALEKKLEEKEKEGDPTHPPAAPAVNASTG